MVVLKELIFNTFYFGRSVMVLKELIFNTFYYGRVWWSSNRTHFLTLSTVEGCGDLERTHF